MQPKVYISYSPSKLGSVFASFHFEANCDIYGWHIEARSPYFSAAFFMVERFYSNHPPHLYRSLEDDVHGPWTIDYPPTREEIRCPVPDLIAHELERVQSEFVEEWLLFRNDAYGSERAAYEALGLPIHEVNIKSRRLGRFHKANGGWTHMSPGIDPNIGQLIRKYWRLNEKISVG